MAGTPTEIRTPDGVAKAWTFKPEGKGPFPAVLFIPDAFSVRPAMHEMCERLAKLGYFVLLPEVFYRAGNFAPFNPKTVWGDEKERARLMGMIHQLDTASAMRDFAAYFDFLAAQPEAKAEKVGCVGYCMGGRLSFIAAAALPDRVGAVAAFHAGNVVTEDPDSPHRSASKIRAAVYFGVADEDRSCTPAHQAALATALAEAKVHYTLELYPGAQHGYAMPDTPAYNPAAYERHWARLATVFGEALK